MIPWGRRPLEPADQRSAPRVKALIRSARLKGPNAGSLAKVYKPCIRKNCPACQRGDKHPAWILSLSSRGRRKTMYVPQAMVLPLRKAIRNGRRIEYLLYRTGPELLKGYRKTVRKP